MVTGNQSWRIHLAGVVALAGYGWLASQAGEPEARPALAWATVVGWVAVAVVVVVVGRKSESRLARWSVVAWAIGFRLVGVGTTPTWEDDYYRYLWDGYQLIETGNPYAMAPMDSFGREENLPEEIAGALDLINHPERRTVYGPVAQVVFGIAAWLSPGNLWVLKLIFVGLECLGWWGLRRRLDWGGWVLVWWCPLAITEVAFAGHAEAIGVALLAGGLAGWIAKTGYVRVGGGVALAGATKPFGWVLAPFVFDRYGWRAGGMMLLVGAGCYAVFWRQGSTADWGTALAMGQSFEYNSTGFALLALMFPPADARWLSLVLTLAFATGAWRRWRAGDRDALPPVGAILAVAFWWSPVFNPWYALWLLPSIALKPSGWGIGVLLAVPLAYTHGWGLAGGAVVNYVHPWWTRPLEVLVVLAVALGWWRWGKRGGVEREGPGTNPS